MTASQSIATIVAPTSAANSARRPGDGFPDMAGYCYIRGERSSTLVRSDERDVRYYGQSAPESNPVSVLSSQAKDVARSLWYVEPGRAEIREEALPPPAAGELRIRSAA